MYIDRERCDAEDGATPESINPATAKVWATAAVADYYYYFAGLADIIQGATLPIDKPDMHVVTRRVPIGGFRQSGSGRESGIDAINDYTRNKTVWINTSSEPMTNPFVMR